MFFFKAAWCRAYQTAFRIALPILPYREPEIVPTRAELARVFVKEKIGKALIVADQGVKNAGLLAPIEEVLTRNGLSYAVYDKTQPNPTVENVEEALTVYRENGCDAIVAVGGGSPIDCAKAVGARVVYPKKSVGKLKGLLRVWRRLPPLIAVAAMERARHTAAMDGDTVRYAYADDTLKALRQLAEREVKAADTRRRADDALARANLTLAGDTRALERMEDRQRAVELATQYREAGLPTLEADRRAAQLVATERAIANQPAGGGGVEILAQNKVAVGGGGVSLRLNDAQLDLSRKSVALQEQQATLLQEIRNVFRSRSNTDLIPVMP